MGQIVYLSVSGACGFLFAFVRGRTFPPFAVDAATDSRE